MSRGLGRVERFVLSWLAAEKHHEASLFELSHAAAGLADCPECVNVGGFARGEVSAATYKAVARAVSSLERRALVRSWYEKPFYPRRGEATRLKVVALSVDTGDILHWIQRLPCRYDDEDAA